MWVSVCTARAFTLFGFITQENYCLELYAGPDMFIGCAFDCLYIIAVDAKHGKQLCLFYDNGVLWLSG